MSDDEEDVVVTGRKKRVALSKSKRNKRMLTLADSSDDEDLFDDDGDENPAVEEDSDKDDKDRFSKDSLKDALTRLKGNLDPPIVFDAGKMTSWDVVNDIVASKDMKLKNLDGLRDLLNASKGFSSEFKCLVTTVAAHSCKSFKAENKAKECQEFFAKKEKCLANPMSNLWLQESLKAIESSAASSIDDEAENMHVRILQAGMHFIMSSFVIDNEKKLKVIKDGRNMDWQGLVKRIRTVASTNQLSKLGQVASATQKHLDSLSGEKVEIKSEGPKTAEEIKAPGPIRKIRLADVQSREREKRIAGLKRGARATEIRQTSTTSSTDATSGWTAQPSVGTGPGVAPVLANPRPQSSRPMVAPSPAAASDRQGRTWGDASPKDQPGHEWRKMDSTSTAQHHPGSGHLVMFGPDYQHKPKPAPFPQVKQEAPTGSTWNNHFDGGRPSYDRGPPMSRPEESYSDQVRDQYNDADHGFASATALRDVASARSSRPWESNSSNDVTTSHDNQTAAERYPPSYGGEAPPMQRDDLLRNKRRQPDMRMESQGSKRPRSDRSNAAGAPPESGTGRGRGRGQTLPAWMTQGDARVDGPFPVPDSARDLSPPVARPLKNRDPVQRPRRDDQVAYVADAGRGRGRGRDVNLPAWMTTGGGGDGGPQGGAGGHQQLLPPGRYNPAATAPIPDSFRDDGSGGGGRGRGRTLPAWMTQNN